MTRHLVEKQIFSGEPIVILDVGARWGMNAEWAVLGDQMRVYCFEPDEAECARLAAEAASQVTYIPTALGRQTGKATLYESKLAASTSLYKTRMEFFGRLVNRDNGAVVAEHLVAVKSLDDIMAEQGIPYVDFIKVDAEGAELDILQGGEGIVRSASLLGILSEIRLHEEINGSPPFASLDAFVRERGFRLYNIHVTRQSRMALPYPQLHDYRTPTGERFFAYTEHGQVQDGDALYFRDLFMMANVPPLRLLKLCVLLEIYCLGDCAAELIVANKNHLKASVDPDRLLDLPTIGVAGRPVGYRDYVDAYFSQAPAASGVTPRGGSHGRRDEPAVASGFFGKLLRHLFGR